MKKILAFTLAFAIGGAVGGSLQAQTPAKPAAKPPAKRADAPINIDSDSFQADLNGKTGTWRGNVVVTQGDMKLRANSVRVSTVDGNADKVNATGNVVVDSPASGTATGENGVYDVPRKIVTMNGNVVPQERQGCDAGLAAQRQSGHRPGHPGWRRQKPELPRRPRCRRYSPPIPAPPRTRL